MPSITDTFKMAQPKTKADTTATAPVKQTPFETFQNKVKVHENDKDIPHAHFDSKGLLTIGYGTLLVNRGTAKLKDFKTLQPMFAKAGITLTPDHYNAWQKAIENPAAYKNHQQTPIPGGLELGTTEMSALLKVSAETTRNELNAIIREKTKNPNNPNDFKTLDDLPEGTQLALLDAMFRGGTNLVGTNVQDAIKENDMAKLLFELRYNSNGDKLKNNDDRNFEMTQQLRDSLSPEQLAAYTKLMRDNPAQVKKVADRWQREVDEYKAKNWKMSPTVDRINQDKKAVKALPADSSSQQPNIPPSTDPNADKKVQLQTDQQLVAGDLPTAGVVGQMFPWHDRTTGGAVFDEKPGTAAPQGDVQVDGYARSDGTRVMPYTRRRPQ
ncbi:MAG: hypothetical protein GC134_03115 [Proteobacteria bacterium]|nr:hypothetical protein [Pseudomonadota bacterium]